MKHVYFSFLSGGGDIEQYFFLKTHHFKRPSSVEFFTLSKERPCVTIPLQHEKTEAKSPSFSSDAKT